MQTNRIARLCFGHRHERASQPTRHCTARTSSSEVHAVAGRPVTRVATGRTTLRVDAALISLHSSQACRAQDREPGERESGASELQRGR